jgi:hypothetical protein
LQQYPPAPDARSFYGQHPHAANASVAAAAERSAQFSLPLLECGCNPLHCFGRRRDQTARIQTSSIYIFCRDFQKYYCKLQKNWTEIKIMDCQNKYKLMSRGCHSQLAQRKRGILGYYIQFQFKLVL